MAVKQKGKTTAVGLDTTDVVVAVQNYVSLVVTTITSAARERLKYARRNLTHYFLPSLDSYSSGKLPERTVIDSV